MMRKLTFGILFIGLFLSFWGQSEIYSAPQKKKRKPVPKYSEIPGFPQLRSRSAIALEKESSLILYNKNITEKRPIASLTKLMTAMVLLETDPNFKEPWPIMPEDATSSGRSHLRIGEVFYLKDLFYAALISSDNRAARVLARASRLSREDFVKRMNQKAKELGLLNTSFVEPTGLAPGNVSTALDCARLVLEAMKDTLIARVTITPKYTFYSVFRHRRHEAFNTNRLIITYNSEMLGGKTGYIRSSGYCLATLVKDEIGREIAFVVLGAPTNRTRFRDTHSLIQWAFRNI